MAMPRLFVASQVVLVLLIVSVAVPTEAARALATGKLSPGVIHSTNIAGVIALTIGKIALAIVTFILLAVAVQAVVYENAAEVIRKRRNGPMRVAVQPPELLQFMRGPAREDAQRSFLTKKMQNENEEVDTTLEIRCELESNLLCNLQHKNIIKLKSYKHRGDHMEIVYDILEEESNGCLYQWLHCPSPQRSPQVLDWSTRRAIMMDVAQGLYHLHHGCPKPIIHHNLNSGNILLDISFKATITGFEVAETCIAGLDQPLPISETRLSRHANYGYTAPEHGKEMTQKVDVYSFGVLLLEIVSGRVAYQEDGNVLLATWAERYLKELNRSNMAFSNSKAVDPEIPNRAWYKKEMAAVFELGVKCTVQDPKGRPSMEEVIKELRKRGRAWSWRSLFCSAGVAG